MEVFQAYDAWHLYILHLVASSPFNNLIFPVWPGSTQSVGSRGTTISLLEGLVVHQLPSRQKQMQTWCQHTATARRGPEELGLSELFSFQSHLRLGRRGINSTKSWLIMWGQFSAKQQCKQPSRITIIEVILFSFRRVPYQPCLLRHNTSPFSCSLLPIFLWLEVSIYLHKD